MSTVSIPTVGQSFLCAGTTGGITNNDALVILGAKARRGSQIANNTLYKVSAFYSLTTSVHI